MFVRPPGTGYGPFGTTLGAQDAPLGAGLTLRPGDRVDGFEIKRLVGRGGMGCVYLARDERLGRLVALKLILPSKSTPERTHSFLEEARITARFSHPHIVVVHGMGEVAGQPYIALEYLDGSTLRRRLDEGRLSLAQAERWALAIARALAAAHGHGVLHCDLKPENVVIPSDGRLRVVDFGLARLLEPGAGDAGPGGTPRYMAPEQWTSGRLTPATDVWALGLVLAEMLSGRHPLTPQTSDVPMNLRALDPEVAGTVELGEAPEGLAVLIRRCLAVDPAARPHLDEIEAHLARGVEGAPLSGRVSDCPFPGLLPYDSQHAAVFFGRDAEVDTFLEQMRSQAVLPVVGPSGAGKSSFVRAGIIPRLQEGGAWAVLALRPGTRPLHTLATRLLALESGRSTDSVTEGDAGWVETLERRLQEEPGSLATELERLARVCRARVLLFVDQAEEICTQTDDPATRDAFLTAVCRGADDPEAPVRVIFTARDDFLGRLAATPAVQAALSRVTMLRRLDEAALREIVAGPLERTHHQWDDPRVVDDIVRELADEPAGLPMLQFACRSLWEHRDRGRRLLLRAEYEAMGGLGGALAQHADGVLEAMTGQERAATRTLLVRLSTIQGTRRVIARSVAVEGLGEAGEIAAERLLSARLLVGRRTANGESALEVAHEALLRGWPRLARWIEESREERALVEELTQAAALWVARGRRDDEAWIGEVLSDARRRLARLGVKPPPEVAAFLDAGAKTDRRSRRRRRLLLGAAFGALAVVALVSLAVAAAFADRERRAREQAHAIALATGDVGRFELELVPFDWDPARDEAVPVSATALPALTASLFLPDDADPTLPGEPLPDATVRHERLAGPGWREHVEARSGAAWVRIDGRGRPGETCGPSWIRVQSLPGFADRGETRLLSLQVPTCAATRAGTIAVPGGPVILGGPGEPPIVNTAYADPEETRDIPAYRLDATEVTNARMAVYLKMAPLTGARLPIPPGTEQLRSALEPDRPATQIDAYDAESYCRFMGKRLPRSDEWAKAVRGT